jgi:hypothetical protein
VGGISLQIPARSYYANRIQREFLPNPRYFVPLSCLQELIGPNRHAAIPKEIRFRRLSRWHSSIASHNPGTSFQFQLSIIFHELDWRRPILMDMGFQVPGLACARALVGAGGQGAGGVIAEQDGRANVAREMERAMRPN